MTISELISEVCGDNLSLKELLVHHSRQVAEMAMRVVENHPELQLDENVIYAGAMLHDIGIVKCDAPAIFCYGSAPYMQHGPLGAELLMKLLNGSESIDCGDGKFVSAASVARICARHTGTGLPGFEPETPEEKVVCYADKFFSKSHPEHERTVDEVRKSLSKWGDANVRIFNEWEREYHTELSKSAVSAP